MLMNERDDDLTRFAEDLQQEILSAADVEGEEAFHAEAYTREMISILTEAGEMDGGDACYHYATGVEISGYSVSSDDLTLCAIVSIFTSTCPPPTVLKRDVDTAIRRVTAFVERSLRGYHRDLEEASPQYDMALRIHEMRAQFATVRLFIVSDGIINYDPPEGLTVGDLPAAVSIWDIRRTHRCVTSGQHREPIEIDFERDFGGAIPCLAADIGAGDYTAFLAIIPGSVLADIYGRYGARLLELNVRSFLQAKGKVNQGIRRTILQQPQRFLAYNNGISATASGLELRSGQNGLAVSRIRDLQIVNGGQTTASLFQAARRDRADLSGIFVQAKITVVSPERLPEVVPLISRYANSQNKVNEADFSANDAYHVELEKLSRTVWAPAAQGAQHQTRWFYERARGQYQDALEREGTDARKRQWKALHPTTQKFTKTDLAKFENTWELLPHIVSNGNEKNFREFMMRLGDRSSAAPSAEQFSRAVARAILFRRTERIVTQLKLGAYRANVVTYTIAHLLHATSRRVDLGRIWREQDISEALAEALRRTALAVHPKLTTPPNGRNVTEWCKRPDCWSEVRELSVTLPRDLAGELIRPGASPYSVGRQAKQGGSATAKQARQAVLVLEEAGRLGFVMESSDNQAGSA
jgi:hypothetical protein